MLLTFPARRYGAGGRLARLGEAAGGPHRHSTLAGAAGAAAGQAHSLAGLPSFPVPQAQRLLLCTAACRAVAAASDAVQVETGQALAGKAAPGPP